ncbi:MAG: hypothetical protein NFCOHLIN_00540 [Gammaproteobacteria bacterium]|nr:hypothetical protein [Gammaproteobacteria bacterium]
MLERELKLLVEEGAIKDVVVTRRPQGGYLIQINGRTLKSARREERQFARLDTAADLLHRFGIGLFTVSTVAPSTGAAQWAG